MKNYSFPDYVEPSGFPKTAIRSRDQVVYFQENSKRGPGGKLILVPHNLRYERSEFRSSYALQYDEFHNPSTVRAEGFPDLPYDDVLISSLRQESVTRCIGRAASVKANIAEMYATRQQTVNMVANAARRIADAYGALRHGDIKGFAQITGASIKKPSSGKTNPPQLWLEYQYGWKPLVQDVYTLLDRPFDPPEIRIQGTARGQTLDNFKSDSAIHNSRSYSRNYVCKQVSKVRVTGPAIQAASQLGVTNPALLAWELLPYSFVVDWFYPVGKFLEQLGSTAGLEFYDSTQGLTIDTTINSSSTYDPQPYWAVEPPFTFGRKTIHYYDRSTGALSVQLPQVKNPLSLTHVSEALSLLAGAFGRRS